ncbi:hypothetical protein [Rhodoflexus sp.]
MQPDEKKTSAFTDFHNENGSVYYDEQTDCVCVTLTGYCEGTNYHALLNKAIELLERYDTNKMLGNTSQSEVISVEDHEWTNSDWAKRAIAAGLQYNAIVLSEDIFGRLSIESITDQAQVVQVKYFDNVAHAKEWLKSL